MKKNENYLKKKKKKAEDFVFDNLLKNAINRTAHVKYTCIQFYDLRQKC